MKLFILPGNDPSNKDWAERIKPMLSASMDSIHVQQYAHWNSGAPTMSLNKETTAFLDLLEETKEPYGVFAKSAGILVALEALADAEEPPVFAIFAGFPLKLTEQQENMDVVELLETIDFPVLFVQNAYDPAGQADEVRRIANRVETAEFALLPGNTHDYPLIGDTLYAIQDFIAEHKA